MERKIILVLNLFLCSVYSMDMPMDPVNGEMIMNPSKYQINLTNGQQIHFVNQETIQEFLIDPFVGLGEVLMGVNQTSIHSMTALCPVCGMNTHAPNGPQIEMKYGNQHIYTCSLHHAHQVHDSFSLYSIKPILIKEKEDLNSFCIGSGTTMQNGFTLNWFYTTKPCILLWFTTWNLNTVYKYMGGCLLIIGCAILNEYLLYIRRLLRKETNLYHIKTSYRHLNEESHGLLHAHPTSSNRFFLLSFFRQCSSQTQHVIHSFLHGFTILFAYLLMLVSMTYDGILFTCCILGYIIGYYFFGEQREKIIEEE